MQILYREKGSSVNKISCFSEKFPKKVSGGEKIRFFRQVWIKRNVGFDDGKDAFFTFSDVKMPDREE